VPECSDRFCGSAAAILYTARLAQLKVLEVLCRGLSEGWQVQMAGFCCRVAEVKWDGTGMCAGLYGFGQERATVVSRPDFLTVRHI
jgi:hypothetical protein